MFLDGDKLSVGDRVFHLSAGYGKVESIQNNTARVKMESGGVLNMRDGGYAGLRKSFYWYEPEFLVPRKGMQQVHKRAINFAVTALKLLEEAGDGGNG